MRTVILNKQNLFEKMAADLIAITSNINEPLICPASGDTPIGLYHELVKRVNAKQLDVSKWNFIGLDEWLGMNGEDEGSCRNSLDREFFQPLHIDETRISFFDGKSPIPKDECRNAEAYIEANEGIDVAILGLGMNGHIAMNEPGTSKNMRSHVCDIAEETQQVGQKYFKSPTPITQGITLGIGTLLDSTHIMLMVTGAKKAAIVQRIFSSAETPDIPATYFMSHPNITIYLDTEAASLLKE